MLIIRALTRLRARKARETSENDLLISTVEDNNKICQRYTFFTQKIDNLLKEIAKNNFEKSLYRKISDTLISYFLDLQLRDIFC